ncbi:effector binding domain-containing protein [Gramella sp. AN32]|uniref:Effector binding domain-containing protein n=1 Tax=Christiangramia antarctica TaxID=2058158 RepID=A0ABW5X5I3_9FLAO|nr:effector binding domain-containing protein [Gramella sp. AN32]MCM4158057.1 AraC family transcriptional regulator [Gramella sp. AN32]
MKILKYIFFLLLIFIIGASVYVATKKGDFQVEDSKMIAAPQELVFNEVNDYTTWKEWEPWSEDSDDMIINYGRKTSGEGASYSWKSENMGDGEMETIKANPHNSLQQKMVMKTPFGESESIVYWKFDKVEDSTRVTWGMKGDQSFMEKLYFSFQDESITEMMNPMFKKGLNNLDRVLTKKMSTYSINVDGLTQHGGGFYMYTATSSRISQIRDKMMTMFTDVGNYMRNNNIQISGDPLVIYNEWNEERGNTIFSAGYFTPSEVITPAESEILTSFIPNQQVLKTTLKGNYDNLQEAWDKAFAYLAENNLETDETLKPFEVYITGPNDNANPSEWVTEIFIPIKQPQEVEND